MQPLNYCRQMVKQFSETISGPGFPAENRRILSHCIDLATASQKFLLPDGGRLYDDPEYRALDETEPLHLPYKFVALEYQRTKLPAGPSGNISSGKAIVFARERDDAIVVTPVVWWSRRDIGGDRDVWGPMPEAAIPRTGFIDRSKVIGGYVQVLAQFSNPAVPRSDYSDEIGALLCFLNVLRCGNVHIARGASRQATKKVKAALPFDTYHVLTVDIPGRPSGVAGNGEHRSPREHLRRGHIRRLEGGRRVWVNATVVGAGRGAGFVSKDYAVRSNG